MRPSDVIFPFCAVIAIASACTTSTPEGSSQSLKLKATPTTTTTVATTANATTTQGAITANSTVQSAQFAEFAQSFGKSYDSNEAIRRKAVFASRQNYINQHNANMENSYKLSVNQFSDWMDSEMDAILPKISTMTAGVSPSVAAQSDNISSPVVSSQAALGSKCAQDWRACGAVTPVGNQGYCGSCWAFSGTGALEGRWFIKHGNLPSLSEEHLVDCSPAPYNYGCNGGNAVNAYVWIYNTKSYFTTDAAYSYTAGVSGVASKCKFSTAMPKAASVAYPAWTQITSNATLSMENAILNALQSGPVNAVFNVQKDAKGNRPFSSYKSGVFSQANCLNTLAAVNHQMVIVGYGSDPVGGKYWIVKNSWATSWGISGYAWIKRGVNMCGIESFVTYPISA